MSQHRPPGLPAPSRCIRRRSCVVHVPGRSIVRPGTGLVLATVVVVSACTPTSRIHVPDGTTTSPVSNSSTPGQPTTAPSSSPSGISTPLPQGTIDRPAAPDQPDAHHQPDTTRTTPAGRATSPRPGSPASTPNTTMLPQPTPSATIGGDPSVPPVEPPVTATRPTIAQLPTTTATSTSTTKPSTASTSRPASSTPRSPS
ncbi:MAG: hypothetical protein QG597_4648 [Actinomycetota bacterium]|nr:hypothetical protein [Actinomycetota bacterium]